MTADSAPPRPSVEVETIRFTASDGVEIVGDFASAGTARGAAIICHPHPRYGGNRFNNVVDALFTTMPQAGITSLRFDFRAEFGGGVAERLDALAAVATVDQRSAGPPIIAVGYSFGAMVVLGLDDDRIAAKVLVAPPLGAMEGAPGSDIATLVLTPEHDQFAPPDVAEPIVGGWSDATFEVIPSVDHFIMGRTDHVAERALDWLAPHLD